MYNFIMLFYLLGAGAGVLIFLAAPAPDFFRNISDFCNTFFEFMLSQYLGLLLK